MSALLNQANINSKINTRYLISGKYSLNSRVQDGHVMGNQTLH